jgi:hypothetical protein
MVKTIIRGGRCPWVAEKSRSASHSVVDVWIAEAGSTVKVLVTAS